VRPTLAGELEKVIAPGRVPRRTGAARLRLEQPGGIQPAASPSGSAAAGPGHEATSDRRSGSRSTVSSGVGLPARRRRRDTEMLLVVRRAERDCGLLDGGRDVRSQS
jgi:hypothetical protein